MDLSFKENFINTREAGDYSGYTTDYIARLIRSGKIAGQKIGHSWFVNKDSLDFLLADGTRQQKDTKITGIIGVPAPVMAYALQSDIHSLVPPYEKFFDKIQQNVSMKRLSSSRVVLEGEILNRFLAFSVAVTVVTFGLFGAQVITSSPVMDRISAVAGQTAEGFTIAFGAIPAQVIAKIVAAGKTEYPMTSRTITSFSSHHFASFSPIETVSPQSFSVVDHTTAYGVFSAAVSTSRVTTRGVLTISSFFADSAIALGYGATSLAHFAIGADVAFAYGVVTIAPQTAYMATELSMNVGSFLMGNVASLPALASGVYRKVTASPTILAPALAEGVLRVEYARMNNIVTFVGNLSLSNMIDVSQVTYLGAGRALASVQMAIGRTFGFSTLLRQ